MEGKLTFVYMPVRDFKSALKFYRDSLGLDEAWREGDSTVAFKLPETDIELMVDQVSSDQPALPGPVFLVPSVDEFYSAQQGTIDFVDKPSDIPGGRTVSAKDAAGNGLYFQDQSKESL